MARIEDHRFYPVLPDVVFLALQAAIATCGGKTERILEYSKSVKFTTRRGLAWRGRYLAEVLQRQGGSIVRVEGTSLSSSARARNAESDTISRILDSTAAEVQQRL